MGSKISLDANLGRGRKSAAPHSPAKIGLAWLHRLQSVAHDVIAVTRGRPSRGAASAVAQLRRKTSSAQLTRPRTGIRPTVSHANLIAQNFKSKIKDYSSNVHTFCTAFRAHISL